MKIPMTETIEEKAFPQRPPKILMVAGEASGDVHAAALLRSLKDKIPGVTAFGMGGANLKAEGLEALFDASEISVMGLVEVIPKLFRILRVLKAIGRAAEERRPDFAILVDVPDFNLRLAKKLKKLGIPVVYYISPMVWASRPWRVRTIRKRVDTMLCILPFEAPWLKARGVDAYYVGNPVLDALPPLAGREDFKRKLGLEPGRRTLAVVPGSRPSEILRTLPVMCRGVVRLLKKYPDLQLVVPRAPSLSDGFLEGIFSQYGLSPTFVDGCVCDSVASGDAAIVCSGTAALEAGLMLRPFVVVYRVNWLSALAFRIIRTVDHISLVNLMAGRRIIPELFQSDCTPEAIESSIANYLDNPAAAEKVVADLREVRKTLGDAGASNRAAEAVVGLWHRIRRLPLSSSTVDIHPAK